MMPGNVAENTRRMTATSFRTAIQAHCTRPGMCRRCILPPMHFTALALSFLLIGHSALAQDRYDRLMRDILIFDAHIDTPRYFLDEGYRLADLHDYYELDLPRMKKGKLGAVFFGIYVQPQDYAPHLWLPRTLECLDALHREVAANPRDIEFAYSAADVERIHKSGKAAALASLEGAHLIGDSLGILRMFHKLGVRYLTLAHFASNAFVDSMTGVPVHDGLSGAGRDLIREMNRIGMVADVSHISDKAVFDTLAVSKAPVLASHSSVKAISPVVRNMPDEVIRAIAEKGGVVCINFHAGYLEKAAYDVYIGNRPRRDQEIKDVLALRAHDPKRWELVRGIQRKYFLEMPKVDYRAILKHIDHIVRIAGPDHVGLGSDFDGISGMAPSGMEDVSKYPVLVKGLMEMGYSDQDIRKIMGLNILRVLRASEEVAQKP
jgi:membrane dipeptidase